jgi:hypothetical protein
MLAVAPCVLQAAAETARCREDTLDVHTEYCTSPVTGFTTSAPMDPNLDYGFNFVFKNVPPP